MTEKNGDLGDFVYILLRRRKFLVWNVITVTLLVMGGSFLLPLRFTATATLLPPKEEKGSSLLSMAALAQRFDLSNVPISGVTSSAQVYLAILRSRTVSDSLIVAFNLLERYNVKNMELARRTLGSASEFDLASAGVIRVSVEDKDPVVAADMANTYVRHLDRINRDLRMGEGKRSRIFIGKRLEATRERLHAAEESLLAFRQANPSVFLSDDSAEDEGGASLMAQRISAGAELEVLRTSFYSDAPALNRKVREVQALDRELAHLPAIELELSRRYRDVKIQERVYEYLNSQFEQAQIQENKDLATVDVLDPAVPPVRKSFPRRGIMTALAFLLATGVGALVVISQEGLAALRLRDDERLRTVVKPRSLLDRLLFGWKSRSSA